jgi:hypothetical protein
LGGEEKSGPADEFEALRLEFLKGLRRQPGDTRALMRVATALSRMAAEQRRMSPEKKEELAESLGALLERFGDLIAPPD